MDIIKDFPNAEEVRELTPVGLQSYIFEQRLKLLRKRILAAAAMGKNEIKVNYVYDEVKEYLIEKGYNVTKKQENMYVISWAENIKPNTVNININFDKKYQTGGIINADKWEEIFNNINDFHSQTD